MLTIIITILLLCMYQYYIGIQASDLTFLVMHYLKTRIIDKIKYNNDEIA